VADILTKLPDFLLAQTRTTFAWGVADCGLLLADWVWCAQGGTDPAAAVRGTYSDQAGADAVLAAHGGFQAYVEALAAAAGCSAAASPQDGDFGVLDMPAGLTGGIMSNSSWVFRTPRGMAWSRVSPGRLVRAWGIDA
jgi:hypothetical protein